MRTWTRYVWVVGGLAVLAGCAQPRFSAPLIPREVLFGNPDRTGAQISADATKLGYLAPVDGVLNVWVGPIDSPDAAQPVTHDTHRGIRIFFFAYTNDHILYVQDKDGDENWRVYSVDLTTNETKDLTPIEGVRADIQEVSPKFPDEILVGLNDRDPQLHDIYRVNIRTGEKSLVLQNDGYAGYVTDDEFNVRFAMRITPDGGNELLQKSGDEWKTFATIGPEDVLTTAPIGFDKTGQVLFMRDSRGRDTAALTRVNLENGDSEILFENPQVDVGGVMRHPTEKTVQAVSFTYLRQRWHPFDLRVSGDLDVLRSMEDADVSIISRSLDDEHWIAALIKDDGPVRFYHYDRATRKPKFLFTNRKDLEDRKLAKTHPVVIPSRDGKELVSYLTLPVGTDNDQDARPSSPVPVVLFVHGGPWARDEWGYNPFHQWLANRGYAVLSVNFRGSTGFGKQFVNAGDREWGGKMHEDLVDAVNWAVHERIADPKQVAIMGGSYGGYATLVGLTFTPDVFACGVDIVGPSNLVTFLESVPPYWKPMLDLFTARIGDHRTEEGRTFLGERSPLTRVDAISKPLLIGQGANDPRVKQAESDQIVEAMQAKNIPVTYVLFPDEGHGFARPENRMAFNAIAECFLAEHLDGRYEPIGDDFKGSSIQVPTGAEQVAGVSEAMAKVETQVSSAHD